jgi:hypothetical protein
MPPVLKGRSPGLIFGAAFAIGLLLLVGAAVATSLSSGISAEQRASQAVYVAFGYQEDCDAVGSTQSMFWCGSLFRITTCHLGFGRNSQTRYYACYEPPEGSFEGGNTGPGQWGCVVDHGGDTEIKLVALHGGRSEDQDPCEWGD